MIKQKYLVVTQILFALRQGIIVYQFSFKHIGHVNKSEALLSMNDIRSKDEKHKVAKKLHKQFGHPTSVKFIELRKNADIMSKDLCVIVEEITKECEV